MVVLIKHEECCRWICDFEIERFPSLFDSVEVSDKLEWVEWFVPELVPEQPDAAVRDVQPEVAEPWREWYEKMLGTGTREGGSTASAEFIEIGVEFSDSFGELEKLLG